jgi:hypothetical protein
MTKEQTMMPANRETTGYRRGAVLFGICATQRRRHGGNSSCHRQRQRQITSWSPDGAMLAYQSLRGSVGGIYVIRLDGTGESS